MKVKLLFEEACHLFNGLNVHCFEVEAKLAYQQGRAPKFSSSQGLPMRQLTAEPAKGFILSKSYKKRSVTQPHMTCRKLLQSHAISLDLP